MIKPDIRIGWATIGFLVAISIAMVISARLAHAGQPTLTDRIAAVIPSLASQKEESVDARELAEAIAAAAKGDRGWAALLLTTAASESALSARIARGECLQHECDGGRAWSLFQIHKNTQNASVWGSPDLSIQTHEALRMLKQAGARCSRLHHLPRATCIVRAYAGHSPELPLPREERRLAMLDRVLRRIQ